MTDHQTCPLADPRNPNVVPGTSSSFGAPDDDQAKGYEGTSAKDWARLAREANRACIAVMDERDALRERLASEIRESEVARDHARALADLRARVEALPYDYINGDRVLFESDVFALFPKEKP